jgi:hypothetical protein
MTLACPGCGCTSTGGAATHAVAQALLRDDLDAALEQGLLDMPACDGCASDCSARLQDARRQRQTALAARERHRARAARLVRRAAARDAARRAPPAMALPTAAADALSRALARASQRRQS